MSEFHNEDGATISVDNFNVTAGNDFSNGIYATINADNFNVSARDFSNHSYATISANDISISANSFINTSTEGDGSITTDTFSLSVAGDFDYADNYINNGNIDATALNLQVGGDFSYDDASNDFVWNAQNSLVVFGSAFITADDFSNYGAINVVNDFNVTAADYFSNQDNATINANSFNVTAGGGFVNYYATISADNFNVTAGKD